MTVQVWQQNRNQSVQPVEVKFKHWQLCVEESTELEEIDDLAHDCEGESFVLEKEVEEAGNEVHSLAIVQFRVYYGVGEEDLAKIGVAYAFCEAERPLYVLLNLVLDFMRQVQH